MQLGNFQNFLDLQLSQFLGESATKVATLWGLELCHNLKIIGWRLVEGRPIYWKKVIMVRKDGFLPTMVQ